jgi:hypothetical protein
MSACSKSTRPENAIYVSDEFAVYTDSVCQGNYRAYAISPYELHSNYNSTTDSVDIENPTANVWRIDTLDKSMPVYSSSQLLIDALSNKAITELASTLRPDSTHSAGQSWNGVRTRDVSYAAYLSLALIDPYGTWRSLKSKLKTTTEGVVIVQDNGTGGSWPVSTDRVVWAMAAWEVYKATGDNAILAEALRAIDNTLNIDMRVAWNPDYKMMHGEHSYLDCREMTYPKWMQPKDIFESMCLGTNVLFAEAFRVRDAMLKQLPHCKIRPLWRGMDVEISNAVNNNLWIPARGYYSEYLYGGIYPVLSQATDNLGQALSILFNVANTDMARSIISKTPYAPYGISAVNPQQSGVKVYHNDTVFVQPFWNLAAKKAGNMNAFEKGFAAMCRTAAFFDLNKDMPVASTGKFKCAPINFDAQLWSCVGMEAMIMRVIMGITLQTDGMHFAPFVPAALTGTKTLSGLKYRDATLSISVVGTGDRVKSFLVNGKASSDLFLPATVKGNVDIVIEMADNTIRDRDINNQPQAYMPPTTVVDWAADRRGKIANFADDAVYELWQNSTMQQEITVPEISVPLSAPDEFALIDVVPVSAQHYAGYTCKPYEYIPDSALTVIPADSIGKTGTKLIREKKVSSQFVETSAKKNPRLDFNVTVPRGGDYFIDFRYANGSGSVTTDNKCALRILYVNGAEAGAVVMPQRGVGDWLTTGNSNMLRVKLRNGTNTLSLRLDVNNMNVKVNTALIKRARIIAQSVK